MSEVSSLLEQVGVDDLNESGLAEVTSPLYVERDATGVPVAACGYRHWPQDIAHLSVLVIRIIVVVGSLVVWLPEP